MIKNYLSNKVKLVWLLPALVLILFVWGISVLLNVISQDIVEEPYSYALMATLVIIVPSYVYNHLRFINFYYELGEEEIKITKGIFGKRVDVVPYSKIQHLRTERTMLENIVGLVHIHFETAGSIHSEHQPTIPGIPVDDHEDFINLINERARKYRTLKKEKQNKGPSYEFISTEFLRELKRINESLDILVNRRKERLIGRKASNAERPSIGRHKKD